MSKYERLEQIEYHVERWEETVIIKELTANQLSVITKAYEGKTVNQIKLMTELLYATLTNMDGEKLMSRKALGKISGSIFMELASKASELNNLGDSVVDLADESLKNL